MILLSLFYPLFLFALLTGFTGSTIGGATATLMPLAFLVVMLPFFLRSLEQDELEGKARPVGGRHHHRLCPALGCPALPGDMVTTLWQEPTIIQL